MKARIYIGSVEVDVPPQALPQYRGVVHVDDFLVGQCDEVRNDPNEATGDAQRLLASGLRDLLAKAPRGPGALG